MTSDQLRNSLIELLAEFSKLPSGSDIRQKVLSLVPVFDTLTELGKSLLPKGLEISARDRILKYFLEYPRTIISHKELMIISGISEWARRLRELRVQFGWPIINGLTAKEMKEQDDQLFLEIDISQMGTDDYLLIDTHADRDAAFRWHVANEIKRENISMQDKILKYFRENIGKQVTGEELRYIANGSEWARRVRELRTEEGWPISTKTSGRPDLPIGVYVLENDRQTPKHDRTIPDIVRRSVLLRDHYSCTNCRWSHDIWNLSDPRHLEVHHIQPHAQGGDSTIENLVTLCNICHDAVHRH